VTIHPADAAARGITEGDWVELRNGRGSVQLRAKLFDGVRRGVLIAESIWPNALHPGGKGINSLTGADAIAPFGGAAFHDNRVALARIEPPVGFEAPDARRRGRRSRPEGGGA
jgi:anaerobic selenocysteine-containing dehydrogenase